MTTVTLAFLNRHLGGKELRITRPQFVIGRHPECHLRVSSSKVSAHHCVIVLRGRGAFARDLDSTNGTFVNGQRVAGERPLRPGDRLRIGPLSLEVRRVSHRDPDALRPALAGKSASDSDAVAVLLAPTKSGPALGLLGLGDDGDISETAIELPAARG